MAAHPKSQEPATPLTHHLFAALTGIFISLGLLKFGTPVVLDDKVPVPESLTEAIYQGWPVSWGYIFLALYAGAALFVTRWEVAKPRWPIWLLLVWIGWQFLSAADTVDVPLTVATLKHFSAATLCFGIGYLALSRVKALRFMLIFALLGFVAVLKTGLEQHFGGLESSRLYFMTYVLPILSEPPPAEYLKKISSTRIFATLFYPNTFAGGILFFLPICLFAGWEISKKFGLLPKVAITSMTAISAMACLYWSGSKSGWLILLVLGLVVLIRSQLPRTYKIGLIAAVLLAGVAGFTLQYANFFQKGATSVTARFDYWRAAGQIFQSNPVLGTGPGTFAKEYAAIKSPESEMARLTHNDYLQQACDSGLVGFLAFSALIVGSLVYIYRYRIERGINLEFVVWLGLLGICAQSVSEFNFYIPALAWPAFLFFGWFWAKAPRGGGGEPFSQSCQTRK